MNNRVYGIIGIKSIMANWNADFSGYPKSISTGDIFGSDKALKYPMKKMWLDNNESVIYIKSLKIEKKKDKKGEKKEEIEVRPRSLKERYEYIFGIDDLKKEKDSELVLTNLFKAIDVKNFGATFAEEGNNISITGVVQIGQGFNKYKDSESEEQQILSPFRADKKPKKNETAKEADASTLGTKIVSDEAHYIYPFAINPKAYKEYIEMGVTEGYTEEDYNKFKEAATVSATYFNTNSKTGCENEITVFIKTDEDLYLPDLAQYVEFEKQEDDKNIIILGFDELLNGVINKICEIEVFYNPYTTKLEGNLPKAKYFNIFTKEEVTL